MIIKKRDEPVELYQLQSLARRLPDNHRRKQQVQNDLKYKLTEIRGINAIDFPLSFIENTYILNDIRLRDNNGHYQIDILLLNEKFILILEVKNWYGTILFDGTNEVIRIKDTGEEEGFANPVTQAKLQRYRLQKKLHEYATSHIPIHYLVVFSFASTIIKPMKATSIIPREVIHRNHLLFTVQQLLKETYNKSMTRNELQSVANKLVEMHEPRNEDILKKFHISSDELIKGVICPECHTSPMIKHYNMWHCTTCHTKIANAHVQAINDYKYLIKSTATNRQLRQFLQIKCRHVMKRLLKNEKFEQICKGRQTKYRL